MEAERPTRISLRHIGVTVIALAVAGALATGCGSSAPGPTASSTTTTFAGTTGVSGTVTATPTCPVERAGQPCPPQPVLGRVDALDPAGAVVASATTDTTGHYSLTLAPGTWQLVIDTGAALPRCPKTTVTIIDGRSATADISCDTGIR